MKLKKIAADWDNVLAFFMGHMTRLATTVIPKIEAVFSYQHAELIERRVLLVGTGGWSKGKVVSSREGQIPRGSYVEKKMMRPVSLGAPLVKCYPAFTKRGLPDKWGNKHKYFTPALEVVNR